MMNPKWLHTPKMQINRIHSSNNQKKNEKKRLCKISQKNEEKQQTALAWASHELY